MQLSSFGGTREHLTLSCGWQGLCDMC